MTESSAQAPRRRVYLVDGSGYIFRAFHAIPVHSFVRADGVHTNAVNGFCMMIQSLVERAEADEDTDYLAVIFDAHRKNFRNDFYPEYKANRSDPPEELIPQFSLIREATQAFNLPCIEMDGFEADDLIATYARMAVEDGIEVVVVSSDKDLMQLVGDSVEMFDPMKDRRIRRAEVEERFGVGPESVVDVQALAGDSTDNVPGVPGIGVKTAAELINTYGDLETLLARAGEIKQPKRRQNLIEHADLARVSRRLVELRADAPVTDGIADFALRKPEPETLLAFLRAQEFRTITARFEARFAAEGRIEAPADESPPTSENVYELVQTVVALEDWIARAHLAGYVTVDIETTSLDAMRAELVGVSLAIEPGRACYIPLAHNGTASQGELGLDAHLARLRGSWISTSPTGSSSAWVAMPA